MGLLEGLVFALDLGFKRNKVNTDSSEIAMEINQGRTRRSDELEMLRKIKSKVSLMKPLFCIPLEKLIFVQTP